MVTENMRSELPEASVSVIIPVHDRQAELQQCLLALAAQQSAPPFEVIVVDDGSKRAVTSAAAEYEAKFALRIIRQRRSGPGAARNAGIAAAQGSVLLFVDSDVVVARTLVRVIAQAARQHMADVAFQLRLGSTDSRMSCRIENARLTAVQRALTQGDGYINYVNTSAFAVRRSYALRSASFFDTRVSRGEDTLLLAQLAREGILPRFLPSARADHRPPGSLHRYVIKHLAIGYHSREARAQLALSRGIILSWPGRLRMLRYLRESSGSGMMSALVSALAVLAYCLEMSGRVASRWLPGRLWWRWAAASR
jgi:glycosyltransferase involved in cell wall biosynthesis